MLAQKERTLGVQESLGTKLWHIDTFLYLFFDQHDYGGWPLRWQHRGLQVDKQAKIRLLLVAYYDPSAQ